MLHGAYCRIFMTVCLFMALSVISACSGGDNGGDNPPAATQPPPAGGGNPPAATQPPPGGGSPGAGEFKIPTTRQSPRLEVPGVGSVAVSADGNTILAGSPDEPGGGTKTETIYILKRPM
jgi:hypothetical protein